LESSYWPPPLRFNAVAGTTYSVVVAGSTTSPFRLGWTLQPANDRLNAPAVLAGSSGAWTGDNVGATADAFEPEPLHERGGASIWFRWTAPATGTLRLDTLGS